MISEGLLMFGAEVLRMYLERHAQKARRNLEHKPKHKSTISLHRSLVKPGVKLAGNGDLSHFMSSLTSIHSII